VDGLRRPAGRRVGPGSAARLTTAARGDYFDNGSIQHLSHVILDMLQFFDMGSDAEPPGADGMFIERVQYMFHSPAIAAGDKDPYANGGPPCCRTRTAAPSRRTNRQGIGTTGAPPTAPCTSAWTDRDTTPWTSPAAGLSPSSSSPSSVPTAEFFRTLRTSQASLDLQDKYGVRAQDNGLERFLTATRRQNLVASGIRCKRTGAVPVHGDVRR
jgi:hypothetical protein